MKASLILASLLVVTHAFPTFPQDKPENDFDYLLGDWEFTASQPEYPHFVGRWSAVRLVEGQILDEYRVLDDKGGTVYVTMTVRNYNKQAKRWELVSADAGGGLLDFGTAQRAGNEMHIEQRFGVAAGKPSLWRIRYYNIQPNSFSWIADRSTDDGKMWTKGYMKLEARRTGGPRTLPALTR
jgi:hypothetical protein